MKFREHRGSVIDSMDTLVEVPDRAALVEHLKKVLASYMPGPAPKEFNFDALVVCPYYPKPDFRTGWDATYIVTLPGYGPIGYTDEPLPDA